jgi:hypothetical protein
VTSIPPTSISNVVVEFISEPRLEEPVPYRHAHIWAAILAFGFARRAGAGRSFRALGSAGPALRGKRLTYLSADCRYGKVTKLRALR